MDSWGHRHASLPLARGVVMDQLFESPVSVLESHHQSSPAWEVGLMCSPWHAGSSHRGEREGETRVVVVQQRLERA